MSGREKVAAEPAREANQGICLKCRRLLPAGAFLRDATGCLTAWCDTCRGEVAKNWSVDVDMVEWLRCMVVFERFLQKEAENVMAAKVNMGVELPAESARVKNRIHQYDMIRYSRIPARLREFLTGYREAWYQGVGMPVPDLTVVFPSAADARI